MLMRKMAQGHILTGWEMHWADPVALSAFLTITPTENDLEGKSHFWDFNSASENNIKQSHDACTCCKSRLALTFNYLALADFGISLKEQSMPKSSKRNSSFSQRANKTRNVMSLRCFSFARSAGVACRATEQVQPKVQSKMMNKLPNLLLQKKKNKMHGMYKSKYILIVSCAKKRKVNESELREHSAFL